jgi:tetratricopeptide (TPR) repeat protein
MLVNNVYHYQGDLAKALADYNQTLQIDPQNDRAYTERGIANFILGEQTKAIADLDKAIQIAPQYAMAYYNRGLFYRETGNAEKTRANLEMALKLGLPSNLEAQAREILQGLPD